MNDWRQSANLEVVPIDSWYWECLGYQVNPHPGDLPWPTHTLLTPQPLDNPHPTISQPSPYFSVAIFLSPSVLVYNARDPLRGVHGDPPGVRRTPGSMRRKGVITCRGSCHGLLPRKAWHTGIHIKTIRYLCMVDPPGSPYTALYARRILVDLGPDPLDAWHVFCFYLRTMAGSSWILMYTSEDPVQWITGITFIL